MSGQAFLRETLPVERYEQMLAALVPDDRQTVTSPMPSAWYPESTAADFQRAWFDVGAGGDEPAFEHMIATASEQGVNRFFRALARVATPRFLIKQAPTIWKHLRRGPATVAVEERGSRMVVRYGRFPFFEDPLYRRVFPLQVATLVKVATGTAPPTRVLDFTKTSLDTEIDLS